MSDSVDHSPATDATIPKPLGSAGDGYNLVTEMGLRDDKLSYNAIVVSSLFLYPHDPDVGHAF